LEVFEFPLVSGWALKEVQKYGKKGGSKHIKKKVILILEQCFLAGNVDKSQRMNAQESSDLPKLTTIQGWITRYSAQLRERSVQATVDIESQST
jgi:hypothetical protein